MAEEVVAFFDIRSAACDPLNTHGNVEVCSNEQFTLGRDLTCRYSWHNDFTISREHIRVHCILYEQDPVADIAPFVYATDLSANGTYLKKSNTECAGSQGQGILMGKNSTFLLDDGDELQLSETVTLIYRSIGKIKQCILTPKQQHEKSSLASRYLITGRLLGEGMYGKVLVGIDQKTQRQLACKMVNLEKICGGRVTLHSPTDDGQRTPSQAISRFPDNVQSCFREFDILNYLSHPNIVHIQKVFWSRSTIYMFQELVSGGDLFSYIQFKQGKITSIETAVIIRQVLKGVEYLHSRDIVHRDLKPDNILMTSLDSGARVVITDFGQARFLPNATSQHHSTNNKLRRMFSVVGTLEYTAPEIHRANGAIPKEWGYSLSVDMWSIGSVAAAMLTGEQIFSCRQHCRFEEDAQRVIVQLAAQCDLSILDEEYHPLWGPIGPAPKDFIKRLLVLDEEDRMSATEALKHIWFTHPMMAAEFEAQYERSVRDWRPRRKDDKLVEQILASKPKQNPAQPSWSAPADDTASPFFNQKQTSFPESPTCDFEDADEPHINEQFASQGEPSSNAYKRDMAQGYFPYEFTQLEVDCGAAPYWASDEQQTYAGFVDHQHSSPRFEIATALSKAVTGQLQRVSTTTRGTYFQREVEDLDNLDGPAYIVANDHVHQDTRRMASLQVCTTPPAVKMHEGVDQWWEHRYPQMQYHYDTQAEPISQDEDEVLVQETPPEVFIKPQKADVDGGYALRQPQSCRQGYEAPFPHKASKPRKVYGRRH